MQRKEEGERVWGRPAWKGSGRDGRRSRQIKRLKAEALTIETKVKIPLASAADNTAITVVRSHTRDMFEPDR